MSPRYQEYTITLDAALVLDKSFKSKSGKDINFSEFFPVKFELINHRLFEKLTNSAQILLLVLVSHSYRHSSLNFKVNDAQLPKFRRVNANDLLLELRDFKYLECPEIKEREKETKEKKLKRQPSKKGSSKLSENPADLSAQKTKLLIAKYCELFKARWNSNPVISGKNAGIAKRIAKDLPVEKVQFYTEAFFKIPDAELLKKKHPLFLFESKLNEVTVFANSGQFTTQRQAQQADNAATTGSLLNEIRQGAV